MAVCKNIRFPLDHAYKAIRNRRLPKGCVVNNNGYAVISNISYTGAMRLLSHVAMEVEVNEAWVPVHNEEELTNIWENKTNIKVEEVKEVSNDEPQIEDNIEEEPSVEEEKKEPSESSKIKKTSSFMKNKKISR